MIFITLSKRRGCDMTAPVSTQPRPLTWNDGDISWLPPKPAEKRRRAKPAEQYVSCLLGHRHWGAHGGAGLLIRYKDKKDGKYRYLLHKRGESSDTPGSWGIPGGALHPGESVPGGAYRETKEEIGSLPPLKPHHTVTDDHGNWSYHTIVTDAKGQFRPRVDGKTNGETSGWGWFTAGEVDGLRLHPGFKRTWDVVRRSRGDLRISKTIFFDGAVTSVPGNSFGAGNVTQPASARANSYWGGGAPYPTPHLVDGSPPSGSMPTGQEGVDRPRWSYADGRAVQQPFTDGNWPYRNKPRPPAEDDDKADETTANSPEGSQDGAQPNRRGVPRYHGGDTNRTRGAGVWPGIGPSLPTPGVAGVGSRTGVPPSSVGKGKALTDEDKRPESKDLRSRSKPRVKPWRDASLSVGEQAYRQMLEDYPPKALKWMRSAEWEGPRDVSLGELDFSHEKSWAAWREDAKVKDFKRRMKKKLRQGDHLKPIVTVQTPENKQIIIIDGHHRALAAKELGVPVWSFIGHVKSETGPWLHTHNLQYDEQEGGDIYSYETSRDKHESAEVQKFNPEHGQHGHFATTGGGEAASAAAGAAGEAASGATPHGWISPDKWREGQQEWEREGEAAWLAHEWQPHPAQPANTQPGDAAWETSGGGYHRQPARPGNKPSTMYHGTSAKIKPGDTVRVGMGHSDHPSNTSYNHFTDSPASAARWARISRRGATPHIYEVEPLGDYGQDPGSTGYRSTEPLRVIREIPYDRAVGQSSPNVVYHSSHFIGRDAQFDADSQDWEDRWSGYDPRTDHRETPPQPEPPKESPPAPKPEEWHSGGNEGTGTVRPASREPKGYMGVGNPAHLDSKAGKVFHPDGFQIGRLKVWPDKSYGIFHTGEGLGTGKVTLAGHHAVRGDTVKLVQTFHNLHLLEREAKTRGENDAARLFGDARKALESGDYKAAIKSLQSVQTATADQSLRDLAHREAQATISIQRFLPAPPEGAPPAPPTSPRPPRAPREPRLQPPSPPLPPSPPQAPTPPVSGPLTLRTMDDIKRALINLDEQMARSNLSQAAKSWIKKAIDAAATGDLTALLRRLEFATAFGFQSPEHSALKDELTRISESVSRMRDTLTTPQPAPPVPHAMPPHSPSSLTGNDVPKPLDSTPKWINYGSKFISVTGIPRGVDRNQVRYEIVAGLKHQARFAPQVIETTNIEVRRFTGSALADHTGDKHQHSLRIDPRLTNAVSGKTKTDLSMSRNNESKWFTPNDPGHSYATKIIAHEIGHGVDAWVRDVLPAHEYMDAFNKMADALGVARPVKTVSNNTPIGNYRGSVEHTFLDKWWERNKDIIRLAVSTYGDGGGGSYREMLAELWSEYTLTDSPRVLAKIWGDFVMKTLSSHYSDNEIRQRHEEAQGVAAARELTGIQQAEERAQARRIGG